MSGVEGAERKDFDDGEAGVGIRACGLRLGFGFWASGFGLRASGEK
jgi:hypothetical protein